MVGKYKETEFEQDNYKEFYEHHSFVPIPDRVALSVHEVIPRFGWAFDKIEKLAPKTLLDLGCLDGSFALTIAKHLGTRVTGIDLTRDGIEIARKRAKENNLPAHFFQGSIELYLEDLANHNNKFDVITMFEVIEHVEDVQRVLKLIDKVLAPGGSVFVSTPSFEAPTYGMNDEKNKCHIRLYTTESEDYQAVNKYGNVRKATSIHREIGKQRIKSIDIHNELINLQYQ